jgi:hypothetical protein
LPEHRSPVQFNARYPVGLDCSDPRNKVDFALRQLLQDQAMRERVIDRTLSKPRRNRVELIQTKAAMNNLASGGHEECESPPRSLTQE